MLILKRSLILGLLLATCATLVKAQDYVVIHVKGEIIREKTKTAIRRGDKINAEERVSFSSPQSIAAVLSSDRGRFILKSNTSSKSDGDLFYIFKSAVQPMRGRMSTRAGGINNALDFQKFFEGPVVFIGEELRVKVSGSAYPQNDNNFFYIRYKYSGEDVNKKLASDGEYLVISRAELLKVDGNPVAAEDTSDYNLFYYQADEQSSQAITPISFSMISQSEFGEMVNSMSESGLETDEKAVADMLTDLYGKTVPDNLASAMQSLGK